MALKCPKCVDQQLEETDGPGGIKVDVCEFCGGLWLDKGEVHSYFENQEAVDQLLAQAEKLMMSTPRSCPRCQVHMKQFRVPGQNLFLDTCAACSGIWFDQGEIETLGADLDAWLKSRPSN